MGIRVQVVLSEHERDLFRRQAKADGLSLSAWLKRAGHDRLSAADVTGEFKSVEDLQTFFTRCDRLEQGREPDWGQHLEVIDRSKATGFSGT